MPDAVVIGAGVAGLSAARALHRDRPARRRGSYEISYNALFGREARRI